MRWMDAIYLLAADAVQQLPGNGGDVTVDPEQVARRRGTGEPRQGRHVGVRADGHGVQRHLTGGLEGLRGAGCLSRSGI